MNKTSHIFTSSHVLPLISLLIICFTSCKTTRTAVDLPQNSGTSFESQIRSILLTDSIFQHSHSGLLVRDLETKEEIVNYKSAHYFTPASNTKLLTFFTALNILGDSINGLKYYETEDSLIIWGTGDPSFLNPFLSEDTRISSFLNDFEQQIYLSTANYQDVRYGSGWSWDDYKYGYQAEKSAFPIYGNMVHFEKEADNSKLSVVPAFFSSSMHPNLEKQSSTVLREENKNIFHFDQRKVDTTDIIDRYLPFLTENDLVISLLSQHLTKNIQLIKSNSHLSEARSFPSVEVDSLYRLLLQPSDNFVAEQLLLNCSSELFDTMNTEKVISWAMDSLLADLPHEYQWVDGSGLSRYNMTTPGNMVKLLELIYDKIDQDRLFRLLPTGGENGTIRNLYRADEPFIFAKTGSLRNNHSLSGYLVGDTGKVYVFSFMNSNYLTKNTDLKAGMDRILRILKSNL